MYTELLNIIYIYVFNYKEPDKHFIEDVLDIVINNDNLREFIKDIDYNYDYNAAYGFTSKILKFNVTNILETAKRGFNFHKSVYEPGINISNLEEYIYLFISNVYFNYITRIRTCKTNKNIRDYSWKYFWKKFNSK